MLKILCPVDGNVIVSRKIKDATFSQSMMGPTVGIIPSSNEFVAPVSGEIVIANGHAFGIKASNGVQVLVHIGIDTVKIPEKQKAKIFKHKIKPGDKVKAGQLLVVADLAGIKKHGYDTTTPVCIISESVDKSQDVNFETIGKSTTQDVLFSVK